METIIIGGLLGFVILSSWILPWINRSKINSLEVEVKYLREQLRIEKHRERKTEESDDVEDDAPKVAGDPWLDSDYKAPALEPQKPIVAPAQIIDTPKSQVTIAPIPKPTPKPAEKPKAANSFEKQFGTKIPVWIGGIALALAGFFMVKYSIETGLITERLRTISGLIFGVALVYAGDFIRNKKNISNGAKISQALTGAGIADLYVCLYAGTSLYHILPEFVGFIGLAAVTAAAVILSVRHGIMIAALGLVGGFLTPALVGTGTSNAPLHFTYLYLVVAGLLYIIRRQNWWILSFPTIIAAYGWVTVWLADDYSPYTTPSLGLFLLAISATIIYLNKLDFEDEALPKSTKKTRLNYLTFGGAITLMAITAHHGGLGLVEWAMYAALSIGAIALAYFKFDTYKFTPWAAFTANIIMIATWETTDLKFMGLIVVLFSVIFVASGYIILWKHAKGAVSWAGLSASASVIYYLLAYSHAKNAVIIESLNFFWGFLALALGGGSVFAIKKIMENYQSDDSAKTKQTLLGIFAVTATTFLSIGLFIELEREFLSVAIATQIFSLAWINTRVKIDALRPITGVVALVFGFVLLPQIALLVQLSAYSIVEVELHLQNSLPIVNWPLFQLGIPALMFVAASYLLRKQKDGRLVKAFEIAAIALTGVMGYYVTRHLFHPDVDILFIKANLAERGSITNVIFLFGLGCLLAGRKLGRSAVSLCGIALSYTALFRIGYFDLISYNPLWTPDSVGIYPIVNNLLLPFGSPIIWSYFTVKELQLLGRQKSVKVFGISLLVLAFTLISLNIRQMYNGANLDGDYIYTSNAETYTYSVVWLLYGLGLLFIGTLKRIQPLRVASLVIMILTVGKVFLYDAAELQGLFRVFSFFGLGLSLLGLSYFYSRFVFKEKGSN